MPFTINSLDLQEMNETFINGIMKERFTNFETELVMMTERISEMVEAFNAKVDEVNNEISMNNLNVEHDYVKKQVADQE